MFNVINSDTFFIIENQDIVDVFLRNMKLSLFQGLSPILLSEFHHVPSILQIQKESCTT